MKQNSLIQRGNTQMTKKFKDYKLKDTFMFRNPQICNKITNPIIK